MRISFGMPRSIEPRPTIGGGEGAGQGSATGTRVRPFGGDLIE